MQQINLYRSAKSKSGDSGVGGAIALTVAALLLVMGAYGGWLQWSLHQAQARVQTQENQQSELQTQLKAQQAELAKRQQSPILRRQRERLQRELRAKRHVLQTLTGDAAGNRAGFSTYLEGLAAAPVEGLWLTQVEIAAGGDQLNVRGAVLRADGVPRLLRQLGGIEVFAGHEFQTLQLKRSEQQPSQLTFLLLTLPEDG